MANYVSRGQRTVAASETIDLNRVRVFTRVVAEGSFTAAARKLGLPKSSVSRSVSTLERTLGVRLLQRTTRALSLTDAGRAYFQQVGPALESVTSSTASVRARGTEPSGRVRISAAPDGAEQLADYVAQFRAQYPRVQVDVSFVSRHVDLVAEGFDLALRGGFLKRDSSLVMRKLMTTNHVLYAAPAYLRSRRPPKTVAQLKDHDCIGYNSTTGRGVDILLGTYNYLDLTPLGRQESWEERPEGSYTPPPRGALAPK